MSNATFHNFTSEPFTGFWNGKGKLFKPGSSTYMPTYLAEHFAKHLTNRELIRTGKEVYTSPKNPAQMPQFMEIFNKAFIPDQEAAGANDLDDEIAAAVREPSMNINVVEKKKIETGPASVAVGPGSEPQIISTPDNDDDESAFVVDNVTTKK